MRRFGFSLVRCGKDGPDAWVIAESWNQKWQAVRKGEAPAPIEASKLSRDDAEAVRRYPPGSVGAAFQGYIRTPEWAARAASARNKVWWPAWFRIREMWGDVAPDTITFAQMSKWRATLEKKHGQGVAHKTIRVWRTFWKIMLGMKIARTADPTLGIRNRAPAPRWQRWCIIAVSWDTQFSPVDVRTLAERNRAIVGDRLIFDRQVEGRTQTGRAAIGTISHRTERLVSKYLSDLGADRLPDALLFRNRSGNPYRDDTLGDDFAALSGSNRSRVTAPPATS
jgi:hypothetical protein